MKSRREEVGPDTVMMTMTPGVAEEKEKMAGGGTGVKTKAGIQTKQREEMKTMTGRGMVLQGVTGMKKEPWTKADK